MGNISNLSNQFDNGSNPYNLHQSDNPGIILVVQPLTNDNGNSCKHSMLMALSAYNKIDFIDKSIPTTAPTSTILFNAWTRANNLVNSWILNSASKEIAASLLYHSTVATICKDFKDNFHQTNAPHIKKKLSELSQGSMTISTYYTQLNNLVV
ncbi:hypothetical protein F3Y22_tig00111409pilonHSYRG00179 [Hibiscus syriacus]|uniref:Retrotransposon gag domain-containing protein n=1 Tax=Hibiscus syriacus TaxID=106335 RepID=A0A6A2XS21_HIBSY|nr:hypothetical protein F3Y22_tig00111409pilonHSYRG00179 [Hibiscus syriacus]